MDLSQFAVDSLVVVAVFIIMNLIGKPLIELFLKPAAPSHDVVIRGIAVLLGVIGIYLDHGFPPNTDGHAWLLLTVGGILSGASAIGVYHVTQTGSPGNSAPATPTAADLATALAAALTPVLARLAPTTTANAPVPRTFTEAANNGRHGMPASLVSESERTAPIPPAGTPPSPSPEPAADAATPAQP